MHNHGLFMKLAMDDFVIIIASNLTTGDVKQTKINRRLEIEKP